MYRIWPTNSKVNMRPSVRGGGTLLILNYFANLRNKEASGQLFYLPLPRHTGLCFSSLCL